MKVCYNKLWKLLIDKGMKKSQLRVAVRSVYKELHADHETGAADNK